MAPRDMIIVALVVLVLTRINWASMNSFHMLILFLAFLMLMLRWANLRKEAARQQSMERYKDEFKTETVNKSIFQWEDAPAQSPEKTVSSADVNVDETPLPAEESSEKTEE